MESRVGSEPANTSPVPVLNVPMLNVPMLERSALLSGSLAVTECPGETLHRVKAIGAESRMSVM
jgi:hypothetical protein